MKNENIKKEMVEIEHLIKNARGLEAQKKLIALRAKRIPTAFLLPVAKLCTRAGIPEVSVALLHRIVRPASKIVRPVTGADEAEYGVALLRLGAVSEAKELFRGISIKEVPETLMYQAISFLRDWDYGKASPLLRQYIEIPNLNSYQRLIGKVNLAISLVMDGSLTEVRTLLLEAMEESQKEQSYLLYALCTREMGNLELRAGNWQASVDCFVKAEALLEQFGGSELHYAKKWKTLLLVAREPGNADYQRAVSKVREEAIGLKNWESVRDIDYHLAKYRHETDLMQFLYFGTPYEAFKKRLLENFPEARLPETYEWVLGTDTGKKPSLIDTRNLKVGMALHRLYLTMTSDFYRPFSEAALFEKLFPGEYYTPITSKYRVHQCIRHLRLWFKKEHIALNISFQDGAYSLNSDHSCKILVDPAVKVSESLDARFEILKKQLSDGFTSKNVCEILKVEMSSAQNILRDALQKGLLEKSGSARATKYHFVESLQSPKKAA